MNNKKVSLILSKKKKERKERRIPVYFDHTRMAVP
jgi:hypothetical protein